MENVNDKNRKLVKALELIGDYELTKPIDEIDGDLIEATVNWSLCLQNKDITLSTEEIEKMVSMIPFKDTAELDYNGEVLNSGKVLKKNKVLFIAAVVAVLVTLLAVISVAFEWNIFEELKNRFGTVADTPVNEEIIIDDKTVYMIGENQKYKTIEDILENKKIDVLYPEELPSDLYIVKIVYYCDVDVNKVIYMMSDQLLTFNVFLNTSISDVIKDIPNKEVHINNYTCYLCDISELGIEQLYFEYKNNVYVLQYNDTQELIRIVENLKELE